ncbi:MAG: RIP metalloprotease RseP [Myxococcales bacterium]|nr:RIP metalloprotease RseP [Myxococcales bacterium]MDH5307546.1 RIP metalloprotease RseP [Myxococcales bacterium]MDH5566326.1 RIP metalloprotease RseP [Myxococcales bacterium]
MTTLFAFVFLLSVLIFVHELGHFIVAKACGVRVLKFSLGFGPPVGVGRFRLRWVRGHTEYVVAWFPIGGFVKMLGENLDETNDPALMAHPEETLTHKPTWQKLAIVFAGPVMNLLLPVAVFIVTLAIGVPRPMPTIGTVEPESPAARAGLRPGDVIAAIAGEPVRWWSDFEDVVRARPDQRVPVAYERAGQVRNATLEIGERSSFDEFGGALQVGWIGAEHSRLSAVVGVPAADSAAARAGLRSGDVIEAVDGVAVEDWQGVAAAYAAAEAAAALRVRRGGAEDEAGTLEIRVPALGDLAALGLVPASVLIASVEPGSPAERAGLRPKDLILSVDGAPVGSFASFAETVRTSEGRALDLVLARDGERLRVSIAPELAPLDVTGLGIEEPRYRVGIGAEVPSLVGALRTDREPNPLVALPRAVGMTFEITHTFLRGLGKLITGQVSRRQVAGPIGIAEIAGNAFEAGWETYLSIMVLISINLGILNLLPIPILDGGQAVIFAIEGIRRSPLSLRTREIFQQVGFTVLVLLMGLAFWNDLSRQWVRLLEWLSGGPGL